ncbi:MAG: nucleotidyltransferase domain-containing protein [bacterium]|nr:MAG: nucleotidyltransferase domain-containing protein [bacterium]
MDTPFKILFTQFDQGTANTNRWVTASKKYFQTFVPADQILNHFSENITIVLHGSTARNVDDEHSDLDYWLVLDDDEYEKFRSITEQSFIPIEIDGKEGHINPLSIRQIEKCFDNEIEMWLINEISTSIVIVDNKNVFPKYIELARQPLSDSVRYAFFFYNYCMMRGYHRSCDNPMERGDEFAVLVSLMQTLQYAFQAAFVLDRVAYPYEKWLYLQAYFFETPKSLIEHVDNIIDEIKNNSISLFGPEKENRISQELRVIRAKLVDKAKQVGINELWLEKWWRYIDRSREIICKVRWIDNILIENGECARGTSAFGMIKIVN